MSGFMEGAVRPPPPPPHTHTHLFWRILQKINKKNTEMNVLSRMSPGPHFLNFLDPPLLLVHVRSDPEPFPE